MTIRFTDDEAAIVALLARVEGVSRATVVRDAIIERLDHRRTAPDFVQRAHRLHTEDARLLKQLPTSSPHRADDTTTSKEPT